MLRAKCDSLGVMMKKLSLKRVVCVGLALTVCLQGLTACGSGDDGSSKYQNDSNSVEEALNSQMAKEDAEASTEATTEELPQTLVVPPTEDTTENKTEATEAVTEVSTEDGVTDIADAKTDVDIDLTVMDSNMVYSTVYQMMADAPSYVGKTVRMKGMYYSSYDEATGIRYFFILVKDATACCQQGLEFIWDDGSHVFPDEYPEDGSDAIVTGVFETYKDNPDDVYEYIRLKDASFEVVKNAEEVSE